MTTQTQEEKRKDSTDGCDPFDKVLGSHKSATALDWAIFGCLVAGGVGIFKAGEMDNPLGVLLCLLGAISAFGLVIYLHVRK